MKLIGLIGSQGEPITNTVQSGSGVGKDEVAKVLVKKYGATHLKFASVLRDNFYTTYDLPVEKKEDKEFEFSQIDHGYLTKEKTINEWMIEFAATQRAIDPLIYVKGLLKKLAELPDSTELIVISDLRQFNEFLMLRALRGVVFEVQKTFPLKPRQKLDCQLLEFSDYVVKNDGTLEDLDNYFEDYTFDLVFDILLKFSRKEALMLLAAYENKTPFMSQNKGV